MSEKSSLAVCSGSSWAAFLKYSLNAPATFAVASVSLSVSGNRSNSSNSAGFGEPEASHSALTMRRIASRTACRVES